MVAINLAFMFLVPTEQQTSFALPRSARLTVGKARPLPGAGAEDVMECPTFHLDGQQVRRRFRTYHAVTNREVHDEYVEPSCLIKGQVLYHGRSFTWEANEGNLLWTTWPSGKGVLLGGEPSITREMKESK